MTTFNDNLTYLHPCPSQAFAFLLRDLALIACTLQTGGASSGVSVVE